MLPSSQGRYLPHSPLLGPGKGFAHMGVLVLIILIPVVGPVALLSRVPEPFDDSASGGQAGAGRGEHGGGITNSTELRQLQLCSSGAFSFHVTPTVMAHVLGGGQAQTGGSLPAFLLRKGEHLQKTEALNAQGCSRPWGAPPRKTVSHQSSLSLLPHFILQQGFPVLPRLASMILLPPPTGHLPLPLSSCTHHFLCP